MAGLGAAVEVWRVPSAHCVPCRYRGDNALILSLGPTWRAQDRALEQRFRVVMTGRDGPQVCPTRAGGGHGLGGLPVLWCSPAGSIVVTDPPANCSPAAPNSMAGCGWLRCSAPLITCPLGAWMEGVKI